MMKRLLYLGLDPSRYVCGAEIVHLPIIETTACPFNAQMNLAFLRLNQCSHVLFTSRTAIPLYIDYAKRAQVAIDDKIYICVGKATNECLFAHGLRSAFIAGQETAEGVIALVKEMDLKDARIFFPRSAQGRRIIQDYLSAKGIECISVDLYETHAKQLVLPDLTLFDGFIFTSPSTVEAFIKIAGHLPNPEKCIAIGPITQKKLECYFLES